MSAASLLALLLAASPALAGTAVVKVLGVAQVQSPGSANWRNIDKVPVVLGPGDLLRTGTRAQAVIAFDDGSRLELGPETAFALEEASPAAGTVRLDFGALKAFVNRVLARRFRVRTPTAVAAVRGTEFGVAVFSGGRTVIDVFKGLVGVADSRGNEVLLRANERVNVDFRGMGVPQGIPTPAQVGAAELHSKARREVGLDMTKEEVMAAALRELKLAEYQQGKVLIDVNGNRVRVEEYIFRPAPNQFKLVVLNERKDRFDYFYYHGIFNRTLPVDLSQALRQLPGCAGTQCPYYLTEFRSGRSNTADGMLERGLNELGGQVDVNANADPADDVKFLFDSAADRYADVSGRPVFKTLFNKYGFYVNGRLKYGWTAPATMTSYLDVTASAAADPISGAALTGASAWLDPATGRLATRSVNVTFPSAGKTHQSIYESYSDGSYIRWDNYVIDDQGLIAGLADFSGITSGAAFKRKLLDYNYEQVVTSSHFGGRKIDLVIEPKILIQAGLVP